MSEKNCSSWFQILETNWFWFYCKWDYVFSGKATPVMGLIVKEKRIWRELCQVCRPTDISFSVVGDKVLFVQEVWWCNCRLISQKRRSSSPWRNIQRWLRRKTGEICEALIDIFLCTYLIFNWQVHCHQKAIWSEAPVHRAYYALQTMQVDKICL